MAKITWFVKANRNHVKSISRQLTARFMTAAPYTAFAGPPPELKQLRKRDPFSLMFASFNNSSLSASSARPVAVPAFQISKFSSSSSSVDGDVDCNGNPCLDLFFNVVKPGRHICHTPIADAEDCCRYLKRVLPLAWSHNPQTTLKLICNLLQNSGKGKSYTQAFYMAAYWLHQSHPKTLACNIAPIVERFGGFIDPVVILHRVLESQDEKEEEEEHGKDEYEGRRRNIPNKAVERYERDPDYQLLHDQVSDLFVKHLKSDIEKLNLNSGHPCITEAAAISLSISPSEARAIRDTMLCVSIARKFFPQEAHYADIVLSRLANEVLVPLREAFETPSNYPPSPEGDASSVVYKYLEEVKSGKTKIVADAFLPHEIIHYVHHWNVGKVAEHQWMTMVEDIKNQIKNGKKILNDCLAVCDIKRYKSTFLDEIPIALGLLVSELSEEPWKGKVINFSDFPELHLIQGDDLRYKCELVRSIDSLVYYPSEFSAFEKMFDVILEVAVNGNLKPEQMIRKVFVFSHQDFDSCAWETEYKAIRNKFKEKGYGDTVPHIVYWILSEYQPAKPEMPCTQPGMTKLSGFSKEMLKLFLDNDGDFGPDQVMEAAISGKEYESLAVVD